MKMKKALVLISLGLTLVLFAGCGNSNVSNNNQSGGNKAAETNKDPYTIGMLTATTGPMALMGDGQAKAINMLTEQINAAGGVNGHPIKLVTYDTGSKAEEAVKGYGSLIEQGALAIVGPIGNSEGKAVAPLAQENKVLSYSLSGSYKPANPYMFAVSVQTQYMFQAVVEYLKTKGVKNLAMLATSDSSGQDGVDALTELLKNETSIKMVQLERVNPADIDVTPQVNNIKAKKPDAIIVYCSGTPATVALKNIYQAGINVPIIVNHGNLTFGFLESIQGFAPKQLYIPATKDFGWEGLANDDPQKSVNEKMHNDYQQKYGKDTDYGAATAYDVFNLLVKALGEVGPDKEKIRSYIENTTNYVGAEAIYNFSPQDHRGTNRKDVIMARIVGTKFEMAK